MKIIIKSCATHAEIIRKFYAIITRWYEKAKLFICSEGRNFCGTI